MATLKDVAALAGVTTTTISRMLNNKCNVSDKTRNKIENAMHTLGYVPNDLARSLSKKNSNFIGLIVPSVKVYFFAELVESIEFYAAQHGCKLLLCVAHGETDKDVEYYQMLMSNKVRGIIILHWTDTIEKHVDENAPVMVLDRIPSKSIPCALTDNHHGGCLAAEHLIGKGCTRLLYCSGEITQSTDPTNRYKGFADICTKAGLSTPKRVSFDAREIYDMDYDHAIAAMFRQNPDIDGIFASSDVLASAIVRHALRQGIRVPQELKVVGYDDTTFAANAIIPLTTVHQPIDELCRYAVDCVVRRSDGQTIPISSVFPVHLVEREST